MRLSWKYAKNHELLQKKNNNNNSSSTINL